jgi:hypothetical protein
MFLRKYIQNTFKIHEALSSKCFKFQQVSAPENSENAFFCGEGDGIRHLQCLQTSHLVVATSTVHVVFFCKKIPLNYL